MSLNALFETLEPMTGCGSTVRNNHCAQAKAHQLDCTSSAKPSTNC